MRTLQDYISEIQPLIRDTTGGTVDDSDIRLSANRGLRVLQQKYGISATKSRAVLKVYQGIYEYPISSDFHDFIDLIDRGNPIDFDRVSPSDFWRSLNTSNKTIAVDNLLGDKYLLVNYSGAGSLATIHDCASLTDNGTWSGTGDATNLRADTIVKKSGTASISFDLSGVSNGYAQINNSTFDPIDLSSFENTGTLFCWVYLPSATYISSVILNWGSDSSNYYTNTATTPYNTLSFKNGWNLVAVDWEGSTQVGTPVDTAIDYLTVRVSYSASQSVDYGFKIDAVKIANPSALELIYASKYFVKSSGGTLQETFSATSDYCLLEDQEADLLFYYVLMDAHAIKEQGVEYQRAEKQFIQAVSDYHMRNGSERKRPTFRYAHLTRR